jgi:hypothetical protein
MRATRIPAGPILTAVLIGLLIASLQLAGEAGNDPRRPPCTSADCRKIESFLKAHYCGESPFGNGPDNGCQIKPPKKPRTGINVVADYDCEWNEAKGVAKCEQNGAPPAVVRDALIRELRGAGLPDKAEGQTYFTVWKSTLSGWSTAVAYYSRPVGTSDLEICEVIVTIDRNSQVILLRKLPFQKTDVDVPTVTQWSLVDLADVDGDGQIEVILEADAYENHWLEVDSVKDGSPHTIFSGLGYYL